MNGKKGFATIILICMVTFTFSQREKKIEVYWEKNKFKKGQYDFYCDNNTFGRYMVEVKLQLENMRITGGNPYRSDVRPGRNRLFTAKPINENRSTNFRYSYTYQLGCRKTKPKADVYYTLPVLNGKKLETISVSYIGERFGENTPENFYSMGFRLAEGDTIRAMRKGKVVELTNDVTKSDRENLHYISSNNFIIIQHEDCTFGKYRDLRSDILVELGDEIIPGQPLAMTSQTKFSAGPHFKFSVYFPKKSKKTKNGEETGKSFYHAYVKPKFKLEEGTLVLEGNRSYSSIWDEKVMTKELDKKEKKKWKTLVR